MTRKREWDLCACVWERERERDARGIRWGWERFKKCGSFYEPTKLLEIFFSLDFKSAKIVRFFISQCLTLFADTTNCLITIVSVISVAFSCLIWISASWNKSVLNFVIEKKQYLCLNVRFRHKRIVFYLFQTFHNHEIRWCCVIQRGRSEQKLLTTTTTWETKNRRILKLHRQR